MEIPIQQMSLADYADLQRRLGARIVTRNGLPWRQVRPFFYRPLLPVEARGESAGRSPMTWPCGFQYVVANGGCPNSTMNFVMLDDPGSYSLDGLIHKRRQLIKRAAQQFQVRPLTDPGELMDRGHRIYLSFHERSRDPYKSDRRREAVFRRWVDDNFQGGKNIVLGGYGQDGLAAFSTSQWVNGTLIYSTLICGTEALRRNLGELMFHELRLLAARHPGIREVYVRPYQGGNSMDQYYLLRGCRLDRRPARLELPALSRALIRWFAPAKYQVLRGEV